MRMRTAPWTKRSCLRPSSPSFQAGTSLYDAMSALIFEMALVIIVQAQTISSQDCSGAPNADTMQTCSQVGVLCGGGVNVFSGEDFPEFS